ncbi:MAG TPA: patatin-like phospholipase family protein [Beijerinckiaceae bacterium]|jgi:NTE family protein
MSAPLTTPTFALALGGGGARGLAHVAVLEAFDELGVKPVAIAGTSIGAVVGAAYAAGMSGRAIRDHAIRMLRDRAEVMAALIASRVGRLADVVAGFGNPLLVDGERLLDRLWPEAVPDTFADLATPLHAVATDYYGRAEAVFSQGPLAPAVAASMALPGLIRPVRIGGRLLVDGGAVNPLPFDHLIGRADVIVAVDVTGGPAPQGLRMPTGFDAMFGTLQIMQGAIVAAKLKIYRPQIVVRPAVDRFRALDFLDARAILAAAQQAKEELKREIERHLSGHAPKAPSPAG